MKTRMISLLAALSLTLLSSHASVKFDDALGPVMDDSAIFTYSVTDTATEYDVAGPAWWDTFVDWFCVREEGWKPRC